MDKKHARRGEMSTSRKYTRSHNCRWMLYASLLAVVATLLLCRYSFSVAKHVRPHLSRERGSFNLLRQFNKGPIIGVDGCLTPSQSQEFLVNLKHIIIPPSGPVELVCCLTTAGALNIAVRRKMTGGTYNS